MEKTLYERYGHWTTILFVVFTISMGITSCTRIEYLKETVYINNTIEKIVEIPCNLTCTKTDNITYDRFELIRRLKFLEGQTDKYFNETECIDNNTKSNYEDKLNMCERDIEELEEELEDCEEEICEYNSTWC